MSQQQSTKTYTGLFSYGTQNAVDNTSAVEGQIRVAIDSERLFFDLAGSRHEITDIDKSYTYAQLSSTVTSIPLAKKTSKVFVASDNQHIFLYNSTESKLVDVTDFKVTSASSADYAVLATNASTAEYAVNAGTADYTPQASSADYATNASSADYATEASTSSYAPTIASTADSTTKIASTEFVQNVINATLANIVGIDIQIVSELPAVGVVGTLYFIQVETTGTDDNIYDEYVWLPSLERYEKLGQAVIDLSNYLNSVTEEGAGNAYTAFTKTGNSLVLTKGSTFLTAHPDIPLTTNSTSEYSPSAGGTFTVLDEAVQDANGHITHYNTKTITLPTAAETASTASYADIASSADYAANGITNITRDGLDFVGTRADGSTFTFDQQDTTYENASTASAGLLPILSGDNTQYLRGDGVWADISTVDYLGITGSTMSRVPYFGNGGSTATAASTATEDCFNFDFGDIDSTDYYF